VTEEQTANPESSVVVVTGAAQGLGRSLASAYAARGWKVALVDLSEERVAEAAAEIGDAARGYAVDVSDEAGMDALADRVAEDLGPIGSWVNNAGIGRPAMLHKMEVADFDLVLGVHVRGTFLGMRAAARQMIETGVKGSILNVTSAAGLQGTIGQINYAAAKGAITAMTKSGARELGRRGIRVNSVAPVAATPMTAKIREDEKLRDNYLARIPLGRFAEPDEVASAFLYLSSPEAAYITGQVLCIDGGLYMAS